MTDRLRLGRSLGRLLLSLGIAATAGPAFAETVKFRLNANGPVTWTVPPGVTSIQVELWGAGGGGSGAGENAAGGGGGYTTATLSVTPGDVLRIDVGEAGFASGVGPVGGRSAAAAAARARSVAALRVAASRASAVRTRRARPCSQRSSWRGAAVVRVARGPEERAAVRAAWPAGRATRPLAAAAEPSARRRRRRHRARERRAGRLFSAGNGGGGGGLTIEYGGGGGGAGLAGGGGGGGGALDGAGGGGGGSAFLAPGIDGSMTAGAGSVPAGMASPQYEPGIGVGGEGGSNGGDGLVAIGFVVACESDAECAEHPDTPMCDAGTCVPCAAGTYSSGTGCLPCTAVESCGTQVTCTTAFDSQCTACTTGTFLQEEDIFDRCVACTLVASCASPITCTNASNSQCTDCGVGFYLEDNFSEVEDRCVPCTDIPNCLTARAVHEPERLAVLQLHGRLPPAARQLACDLCTPVVGCSTPIFCTTRVRLGVHELHDRPVPRGRPAPPPAPCARLSATARGWCPAAASPTPSAPSARATTSSRTAPRASPTPASSARTSPSAWCRRPARARPTRVAGSARAAVHRSAGRLRPMHAVLGRRELHG
jgi:hypothetical protein